MTVSVTVPPENAEFSSVYVTMTGKLVLAGELAGISHVAYSEEPESTFVPSTVTARVAATAISFGLVSVKVTVYVALRTCETEAVAGETVMGDCATTVAVIAGARPRMSMKPTFVAGRLPYTR